jgi:hypothetical protein
MLRRDKLDCDSAGPCGLPRLHSKPDLSHPEHVGKVSSHWKSCECVSTELSSKEEPGRNLGTIRRNRMWKTNLVVSLFTLKASFAGFGMSLSTSFIPRSGSHWLTRVSGLEFGLVICETAREGAYAIRVGYVCKTAPKIRFACADTIPSAFTPRLQGGKCQDGLYQSAESRRQTTT